MHGQALSWGCSMYTSNQFATSSLDGGGLSGLGSVRFTSGNILVPIVREVGRPPGVGLQATVDLANQDSIPGPSSP